MQSIKEKIIKINNMVNGAESNHTTLNQLKNAISDLCFYFVMNEEKQQPEVSTLNGEVVGVSLSGVSIKGLQKIQIIKEINKCDRLHLEIECEEPLVVKELSNAN